MRHRRLSLALAFALVAGTFVLAAPAANAAAEVSVGDFYFEPANVSVKVGEPVSWRFVGKAPHTVTAFEGQFHSGAKYSGTFTYVPEQPGTIGYFCAIHPDMQGTISVEPLQATELDANDTVGAAIAWSKHSWPDGSAGTVILGRSDVFADSLSSGALQGALDAPLLLTPPNSLAGAVRAELERLGAARVVLLGGNQAVSPAVADRLRSEGYRVSRVAGDNRYETATAIADQFLAHARTALIARGTGDAQDPTRAWVDSLAAGAVAARTGQPLLLSATEGLSRDTQAYLQESRIEQVTLVGGEAALSPKVAADIERLGIAVDRAAGEDRFHTARAVNEIVVFGPDPSPLSKLLLVDGRDPKSWASGFAAASVAVRSSGLVMLTDGANVPAPTYVPLTIDKPGVVCGPFVNDTACQRANTASNVDVPFELPGPGNVIGILTPEQETQGGAEGATGAAWVSGTSDPGTICYNYFVPALPFVAGPVEAAHIHEGAEGEDGPPVVTLSTEVSFDGDFDVYGCTYGVDPALIDRILSNPADFYVNVHTEDHPAGATRGQLFTIETTLLADMTGDQEVQGGAEGAGGFAFLVTSREDPQQVCHLTFAFGLMSPITASHIHEGEVGQPGPPVVTLVPPQEVEEGFAFVIACIEGVDEALLDDIEANPRQYFVNVHTEEHQAGAIRGQLLDPFKEPTMAEQTQQPEQASWSTMSHTR